MNDLIFADGTRIPGGYVLERSPTLFFYLPGLTMREAFELMIDPEKTAEISQTEGETLKTYRGYTNLINIQKDTNTISGGLTR